MAHTPLFIICHECPMSVGYVEFFKMRLKWDSKKKGQTLALERAGLGAHTHLDSEGEAKGIQLAVICNLTARCQ